MSSQDHGHARAVARRSAEARLLKAELRGDEPEWRRIGSVELVAGWWYEVAPAAFALAAQRRFGPSGDRRMVTRFVRAFLDHTPGADAFAHRDAEAVLRSVLGEAWLLTPVDAARGGPIMYAALFALIDDLQLTDDQADALIDEAEATVAEAYRRAETPPPGPADAPALTFDMHRRTRRRLLSPEDELPDRPTAPRPPRGFQPTHSMSRSGLRPGRNKGPSSMAGRRLRAVLLRDSEEQERLNDAPDADVLRVHRAALETALPIYLHPDPDVREIAALVRLTRDTFYPELDVMKTEFLARTALGEDVPLDGVSRKDLYLSWTLLLHTIFDWWDCDLASIDTVITHAESAVTETGYDLVSGKR